MHLARDASSWMNTAETQPAASWMHLHRRVHGCYLLIPLWSKRCEIPTYACLSNSKCSIKNCTKTFYNHKVQHISPYNKYQTKHTMQLMISTYVSKPNTNTKTHKQNNAKNTYNKPHTIINYFFIFYFYFYFFYRNFSSFWKFLNT